MVEEGVWLRERGRVTGGETGFYSVLEESGVG